MARCSLGLVVLTCMVLSAAAETTFCTADVGVEPYETLVDEIGSPYALQVAQLAPDNQVVLMLASGTLYRSMNGGKTFDKVDSTTNVSFSSIMRSADERVIYLPSATDLWVSSDKGETFTLQKYDKKKFLILADQCETHPTEGQWLLCMSWNPNYIAQRGSILQAVVTQNMGANWTIIADYAADFAVDHPTLHDPDMIFVSRVEGTAIGKDQKNYHRTDYVLGHYTMSSKKFTAKITGCPGFFTSGGDYIAPEYAVSKEKGIFLSQIWHSIDHGQEWYSFGFPGNMYVWNSFGLSFSEDHDEWGFPFYITDNATFFFTWSTKEIYSCYVSDLQDHAYSKAITLIHGFDFAPFESLDGILVANTYADAKAQAANSARTSITYDNGGSWYPLRIPAGSSCPRGTTNCQLNLFGPSDSMFGRFYSWYDAVGLMIGTGTIGTEVGDNGDVNTYMTSDGGLNWQQIRDGPTTYEFGDHGGLIVFVDDHQESTDILYTWNGGNTFSSCAITDKAFTAMNIITGNVSSSQFWIYGTRTIGNLTRGVVVLVDFSQFHERICEDSDYESFVPQTPDNSSCILGQITAYKRRKLNADCFNPTGYETATVQTICPCREDDYECGYCYEYNAVDNRCHWTCDADDQGKAPEDCVDVWYPKSQGWRLVPGTQCNMADPKSIRRLGTPELCPGSGPSSTTTMVVLSVLFVIILLTILAAVGFIAYSQNDAVKRWVNERFNQAPEDSFSLPESALADKAPADE